MEIISRSTRKCAWCGSDFEITEKQIRSGKKTCNHSCANRLWSSQNGHYHKERYLSERERILAAARNERQSKRSSARKCGACGKPLNITNRCGFCKEHRPNTWYLQNKERRKAYETQYLSVPENREKYNRRFRERRRLDVNFRLAMNLRGRLKEAIRNNQKAGSAVRDLSCSIEELKAYLISRFQPGMSWENWGKGYGKWQIDHIRPLCKFDLADRDQLLEACNYKNLRPMWYEDHSVKSGKERKDV